MCQINIPNLGLPDLCIPPQPTQLTFAYDITSNIPFSLSLNQENDENELKFGIGNEEALPADIAWALWSNRVPEHEPWPRVLKIDGGYSQDTESDGYKWNVDWVDQYTDNDSESGSEPIGKIEGDEKIERKEFWRR